MEQPCYCGQVLLDPDHCTNVREGKPVCEECVNHVDAQLATLGTATSPLPLYRRDRPHLDLAIQIILRQYPPLSLKSPRLLSMTARRARPERAETSGLQMQSSCSRGGTK